MSTDAVRLTSIVAVQSVITLYCAVQSFLCTFSQESAEHTYTSATNIRREGERERKREEERKTGREREEERMRER
jgi:hypothetical protein